MGRGKPLRDADGNIYGYSGQRFDSDGFRVDGGESQSSGRSRRGGMFESTGFRDKPQRSEPSVTNTFFNSGSKDGENHGHVKYRDNPDGTTDYLYARDVKGNEYDV